jgi:molybdopterin-guanine dinucleotide biosynthesis protein A
VATVSRSSSSSSRGIDAVSASASRARVSQSSTAADCTGVLLVGGAASRFGSPKALARLGGETLAERGWRALAWCAERIAVGKAADALPVPFPVLDDRAEERAPIFGVAAALRSAAHDVCVVLPVDCPLVSEDALQTLAAEVAVPQTGPLPGAYARSMLAELDARIARGDLSLRGVNPHVVELDPGLLANVNTPRELAEVQTALDEAQGFYR